jgi:hypothetical protein
VLLRVADDLYPGHNQLTISAAVTAPVRAAPLGPTTLYIQAGVRTLLPLLLLNDAGDRFHNCSAVHLAPGTTWVLGDEQTRADAVQLYEDVAPAQLPPGVCTAAAVVGAAVAAPAAPVTVTAVVRLDSSLLLRAAWQVVVFPPLRAVLFDCAAPPAAASIASAAAAAATTTLDLRVAPGSVVCVQLLGGPVRAGPRGDAVVVEVAEADTLAPPVVSQPRSAGERRYVLACGATDVTYTATFTSTVDAAGNAALASEEETQGGATAAAAVRVTCAAPAAVVVDLLTDLERRTDTAEPSSAVASSPWVSARPLPICTLAVWAKLGWKLRRWCVKVTRQTLPAHNVLYGSKRS